MAKLPGAIKILMDERRPVLDVAQPAMASERGSSLDVYAAMAEAAKRDGRDFVASFIHYGFQFASREGETRASQIEKLKFASPEDLIAVLDRNAETYGVLDERENRKRFREIVKKLALSEESRVESDRPFVAYREFFGAWVLGI